MIEINELFMGNQFDKAVNMQLVPGLPAYDFFINELVLRQGIADFVGVHLAAKKDTTIRFRRINHLESSSRILSLLKYRSGRSENYLKTKANYTADTFRRGISDLEKAGYVVRTHDLLFLGDYPDESKVKLWAFELKLSDWKRALFQALQYCSFADYSVIVFPQNKYHLLKRNITVFRLFKIGILLFDPVSLKSEWLIRPGKITKHAKFSRIYAINQVINRTYIRNEI